MPPYTPAVRGDNGFVLQEVILSYFNQGYTNTGIVGFLAMIHGVVIGLSTLKRWLRRLGLKRAHRENETLLEDIVSAILLEIDGSVGSFVGYREMTRRLRIKHHLIERRDTVMRSLRIIDPEGVQLCQRRWVGYRWVG